MNANKIIYWLAQKGIVAKPLVDFTLFDAGDGVCRLIQWDSAKLGPLPTEADLAVIDQATADAAAKTQRRDPALWAPQIVALTKALHDRLRAAGVDQVTMAAFRAAIEAEFDKVT